MRTFRSSAEQLLQLSLQLSVRHLLLNMNTFPDISVYDQVWLGTHWMPEVEHIHLERVVLINNRHRLHNQMAIDALIDIAQPFIRCDIQYFPQPASGLHWLSDHSERLPALLAEWDAVHSSSVLPAPGTAEYRSPQYRPYDS
ncbi:hypothetical protein [Hymenobacter negativus]|uniref:STAS/SEC14 domain-containing protein n=1 Tax=Hymenobacter negativus TaxID=2795026 RepID=A0ABS3QBB2_9BACT|nr:hypothetical protein [Hymenobacter negativus]MBO2008476.1 hypothetical protein [Hymenobacter negativus]